MKNNIIYILIATLLFSYINPNYAGATENTSNNEIFESPEAQDISSEDIVGVSIESEVVDTKDIVEVTIDSGELDVSAELDFDLETSEMNVSTIVQDENGKLIDMEFEVIVTAVNGEDFSAILIDIKAGEQYNIDTTKLDASIAPLVVIAIHVARYGIQYAIKKHGKKAVQNAIKKNSVKAKLTTDTLARQAAKELGYKPTNFLSQNAKVFERTTGKGSKYITRDRTSHVGGVWKGANTVKNLGSDKTMSGTYDATLKWIAK